jgi:hypothetical protein
VILSFKDYLTDTGLPPPKKKENQGVSQLDLAYPQGRSLDMEYASLKSNDWQQ